MTYQTHLNCGTCGWLAREAERTAKEQDRDHWVSTTEVDGTTHAAHYQEES